MEKYQFSDAERSFLEMSRIPFAVYQFLDKKVVSVILSDGFMNLFEYTDRTEAHLDMDRDMYKYTHPDDVGRIANEATRFATEGGTYDVLYRSMKKDGYHLIHASAEHVYTDTGERLAQVWYMDEGQYSEEKESTMKQHLLQAEKKNGQASSVSYYNYLTGLPNMESFFDRVDIERDAITGRGETPVLLFIDLNNMRFFNNKYGYVEGNRLLQAVARLLIRYFGTDSCCHLGQDHFSVITVEEGIEDKLSSMFQDGIKLNDGKTLPMRVGLYAYRSGGENIQITCDRARFACNTLRNTYVSGFAWYNMALENAAEKQQYVIQNLDRAIEERWLTVYYQPIIRAANGKVCEEEALSRWNDPESGLLSPMEFVPALEEAGLIYKLDLYVLERILDKLKYQEEHKMINVPQSFNLSRSDFDSCDIVEEIRRRVDASGIDRRLIKIELTESMVGSDFEFMKKQIGRFRELGFHVWMDDFGSGYSTLDLIQQIEFDLIKFDVQFMQSFDNGENGRVILTELMKLAIGLGIDTICEGVETEEEVQFLREIGCEKLQGYYYNRPIPFEEIKKRYEDGLYIGFEQPEESKYYNAIGQINLYDLAIVANQDSGTFRHYFNMVPMAIMEVSEDRISFVRTNQAYREFVMETLGVDISGPKYHFSPQESKNSTSFIKLILECRKSKGRSFVSDKMNDNLTVHSFVRWLADNPLDGSSAIAIVILTMVDSVQETTYENIARALAQDYFKLYYVDMETEHFIEYSSDVGEEELAIERHGEGFFKNSKADIRNLIYVDDRENFVFSFTKENVQRALDEQGTYTLSYRQIVDGEPVHVNLKARRMQAGSQKTIFAINRVEDQARLEEGYERSVFSNAFGETGAGLASATLDTVSFAVKSCIKLMVPGDFKENVYEVLNDIMKAAQADSVRIMLVNNEKKEISIFSEVIKKGLWPDRKEQIAALSYDMIAAWEGMVDENNAIIVQNEYDMEHLEKKNPLWVATMRKDGAKNVVLVPLHRSDHILGYLYVINFNPKKTAKVKELIELVSFFLSSEISNYLFREELEFMSTNDELTGLKNRHAMIRRTKLIGENKEPFTFGIITMDLNGLKRVNDTEGHFAGDALILRTANFLREIFGPEELYRIGGDEFIVIFPGITKDAFDAQAQRLRDLLEKEDSFTLAIGPYWSESNDDVDGAFYRADLLMYENKKVFYEKHPELKEKAR